MPKHCIVIMANDFPRAVCSDTVKARIIVEKLKADEEDRQARGSAYRVIHVHTLEVPLDPEPVDVRLLS